MVIDDIADREHDCDILLDQNFFPSMKARYESLVPKSCKQLLGPKYALLRPEFREYRKQLRKRNGDVKRLLITFGGSDSENVTEKTIEAISRLNRNEISSDIVVGAANPNREKIKKICSALPNIYYHYRVDNMAKMMENADLFIGSCGSTTWERCCLGLPGLVIAIANNQTDIGRACNDAGIGIYLDKSEDITPKKIQNEIKKILYDKVRLLTMSKKALKCVDGNGAKSVAQILANHTA
jgi:UDP-2,4-diacetamido-2,4,6-trideoxy-beta-L-altropyranose hydrolase